MTLEEKNLRLKVNQADIDCNSKKPPITEEFTVALVKIAQQHAREEARKALNGIVCELKKDSLVHNLTVSHIERLVEDQIMEPK